MLDKFLNKKVGIVIFNGSVSPDFEKGFVTAVDENFIELDNNLTVAIKYIMSIEAK